MVAKFASSPSAAANSSRVLRADGAELIRLFTATVTAESTYDSVAISAEAGSRSKSDSN